MVTVIGQRDLLLATAVVAVIVIGGVFSGHQNNGVVPVSSTLIAHYHSEPRNLLDFWADWDAPVYITLSQHSYQRADLTNFFPLYPLLIHIVNLALPSALLSALVVAWTGFVGAVYFYLKIIKRLFGVNDNREALRGILPWLLFPTGVFLFAPYTEGLFGLLALGSIYFALHRNYLLTALFSLFATATHITGAFVLVLVGFILLEEGGKLAKVVATVAAGSLGLITYMIYLQIRFHSALAFVTAQKGHGWLEDKYAHLVTELGAINMTIMALLIVAVIYWWPRRKSFSVYLLLFLIIPVIGGQLGGFNRYTLMAFPAQWMLYDYFRKRPLGYALVIAATTVLWAHYLFQYAGGYVGG
jgi:Gpi18-like mannosyltransferase